MTIEPDPSHRPGELDWLAEQYVLGELALEQWDAFESRLASDQAAREAVASAVALMAASYEASITPASITPASFGGSAPAPGSANKWLRRAAGFSVVAASLTLVAFFLWQTSRDRSEGASTLARAWSDTRESIDEDSEDEAIAMAESSHSSLEEVDLPDWLVTAVSLREESAAAMNSSPEKSDSGEGA